MKPVIFGLSGLALSTGERAFFADVNPAGYILFKRNVENRRQLRALTDELRALHGRDDVPILIDQEGGRVSRLPNPEWPAFPAGAEFDALYDVSAITAIEAARLNAEAMALTLSEVGVNVNCMPILDVRGPQTTPAIGDRALGSDPVRVAALGKAILDGMAAGGVAGVIKHMPGHGRAVVDSHHDMPVVTATCEALDRDIAPFRALKGAPMGMTCHVVYPAYDPDRCATMSPPIIADVIRGAIGFDGLLMSDDLEMSALKGSYADRAEDCIHAGCDVALFCSGKVPEMIEIASRLPEISPVARRRLERAMATISPTDSISGCIAEMEATRDALLMLATPLAAAKHTHAATGAA
jgi:beta-N-acetylhexosaminidase